MLEKINSSQDVKKLNLKEKEILAQEIRKYILDIVSKNGGHLASNLGVVELTIALNVVFDIPTDKVVWDVGHQTYVHKIINGRKEELKKIRTLGGIAGFPKTNESETDCFNTGHSSTSISAALGMARARDIKGNDNSVIAVIGDRSSNRRNGFRSIKSCRKYLFSCSPPSGIQYIYGKFIVAYFLKFEVNVVLLCQL